MGKSVLTPEESLLGKVMGQYVLSKVHAGTRYDDGGKGIRLRFRNLFVGRIEATKQKTTVGHEGSLA